MRSTKNLTLQTNMSSNRGVPLFDNHYNNGVLIDNWQESRIYDACGRKFTLAMDRPVSPLQPTYTADYTNPGSVPLQPMMRRRGLGKELILGTGNIAPFEGIPTSTTYGATQRQLVDSKYGTQRRRKGQAEETTLGIGRYTFSDTSGASKSFPTADENLYDRFTSTKGAMDLPIEYYHFQRQMMCTHNTH